MNERRHSHSLGAQDTAALWGRSIPSAPPSFACRWLEASGSLAALQQMLGHASVTRTERYARLSDDLVRAEAERVMGNAMGNILGSAARQGEAKGYILFQSVPLVRWLLAESHEQLDRPDSAAAYFDLAIASPPVGGTVGNTPFNRMAFSFGHRRLVLQYARMGRLQEARRHWEIFQRTFTNPDPELRPMIEEARQALAKAEARP